MTANSAVNPAGTPSELTWSTWWRRLWGLNGLITIIAGLVILLWPDATLSVLSVILGIWLVVAGVIEMFRAAVTPRGRDGGARAFAAFGGLAYAVVGVFLVFHPYHTVSVLAAILGAVLLLGGVLGLFANARRKSGWRRLPQLAIGIVLILAGLVVLIWPSGAILALVRIAGIALLALGVIQLVAAYRGRKKSNEVGQPVEENGTS